MYKIKLCKIAEVISGATPSTSNKLFWNGDIPWITPLDLSKLQGVFIKKGERSITNLGLDSCSARLFDSNSVIVSTRAPIGLLAVPCSELTCINQGCKAIVCGNNVDNRWLYYYLTRNIKSLVNKSGGTTFKEISKDNLNDLDILLPDLSLQHHIVDIM